MAMANHHNGKNKMHDKIFIANMMKFIGRPILQKSLKR